MVSDERREERVPSDVVMGVFFLIDPNIRFEFNYPDICRFFYGYSQKEEYKKLFEDILFDTDRTFPKSYTVSFAKDRLLSSCMFWTGLHNRVVEHWMNRSDWKDGVSEMFSSEEAVLLQNMTDAYLERFEISGDVTKK